MALVAEAVSGFVQGVGSILDNLFTSDEERAKAAIALKQIEMQGAIAQARICEAEAKSRHWFAACARPAMLWGFGLALLWQAVGYDLFTWAAFAFEWAGPLPPKPEGSEMSYELVAGMLGLAGMRSHDKAKGVTR